MLYTGQTAEFWFGTIQSKVLNPILSNFATILRDGEMNNIIILVHQKTLCFSPFNLIVQSGHQFCPKSEIWYLSKTISFLKCPLIPTFLLLIKAIRCDQMNRNVFSQGPIIRSGVFCCPHFKSDIRKTTEGQMWNWIIFYFILLKKKKWNEMRWERNLVLNNEMRMNDIKTKPCI